MTVLIISGLGHWMEMTRQRSNSFPHFNSLFKLPRYLEGGFPAHLETCKGWRRLRCPVCSLGGAAQTGCVAWIQLG